MCCKTKKILFLQKADENSIIAFRDFKDKVRSAKVISNYCELKSMIVKTKYGREFTVAWDNVLWVKTEGQRWPRGIYEEMKKNEKKGEEKDVQVQDNSRVSTIR